MAKQKQVPVNERGGEDRLVCLNESSRQRWNHYILGRAVGVAMISTPSKLGCEDEPKKIVAARDLRKMKRTELIIQDGSRTSQKTFRKIGGAEIDSPRIFDLK